MTQEAAERQTKEPKYIVVPVLPNHPLLKLKAVLPWTQLINIADATWNKNGKNVRTLLAHGPLLLRRTI